ncbi:MAG: hypothetical protein JXP34_12870 [Planctomycetes bacterium]|nr:hypothetical protein [Planctomycetota bacterium]
MSLLAALMLVAPGEAGDTIAVRYPTLAVETESWSEAREDPRIDPRLLDLDPRGGSILFVRGADPARVIRKELASGREIAIGDLPFAGLAPPRFSSDGASIYVTGVEGTVEDPADGAPRALAGVFRFDRDGGGGRRIVPPSRGRKGMAFAVLLDVRPDGGALLVGTGSGLEEVAAGRGPFEIFLEEHDLATGEDRPLGPRIPAGAPAFYHRDGRGVFFGDSAGPRLEPLRYFSRRSGQTIRVSWNADRVGRPAGEYLARRVLARHLGGFDRDDHPTTVVARAPLTTPIRILAGGDVLSIRGDRMLLASPSRIRVAPIDRARLIALGREEATPVRLDPARILAGEAGDAARAALEGVRRRLGAGPRPRDLVVRYVKTSPDPESFFENRITVWETAAGLARIETIRPGEAGDEYQTAGFDGERAWLETGGRTFEIALETFERLRNGVSPYRLLFDPAGLDDPGIRFRHAGEREGEIVLAFDYDDGFRGELRIDANERDPLRIVTPLDAETVRLKPQLGIVREAREIAFLAWRDEGGRRIPARIRFDTGFARYDLAVGEVIRDIGIDPRQFRRPEGSLTE